jgi:hypothetical protein
MAPGNGDLHGNAPDQAGIALILTDLIDDLEFTESGKLLRHALPMAQKLAEIKHRAKRARIPIQDSLWHRLRERLLEVCEVDRLRQVPASFDWARSPSWHQPVSAMMIMCRPHGCSRMCRVASSGCGCLTRS